MIKILKAGKEVPPHMPLLRGKCDECGCEIEADISDTREFNTYRLINCPTPNCGVQICMYKHVTNTITNGFTPEYPCR